jgi:release factor glutamine methyltransferase
MQIPSNKVKDVVRFFKEQLKSIYEPSEISILIALCFEKFTHIKRAEIVLKENETISESQLLKFNFAIKDLKKNVPIQYVLGETQFFNLPFLVTPDVLIPRPETEELVSLIINDNKLKSPALLDIGTGSGCIPIAIKKSISSAQVVALDVSEKALEVAKKNAAMNQAELQFVLDDILNPKTDIINQKFDIVVSNPPYIGLNEKDTIEKNVLDYEPHLALFVNDVNPLLFYDVIADLALKILLPQGRIYFEINEKYGEDCLLLLNQKGFKNVTLLKDLSNKNRILRGNI